MGSYSEKGMNAREKATCLFSGGIDSPVALALMAKKLEVIPLHFCLYPFTCEGSFSLAIEILKNIKRLVNFEKAIIYPWAEIFKAIVAEKRHRCLLCRKAMFKAAEIICERENAIAIITGEVLGQKASQTTSNLFATSSGIKYPILRPLLGLDKEEIRAIAKKLGTYSEKHAGCCYASPENPATQASPEVVEEIYSRLDIQKILEREIEVVLELKNLEEVNLEDLICSLIH